MKIVFDASIHLGQFVTTSEAFRVACKNSQISLSTKPTEEMIGVVSFNENSWSDHVIWGLEREPQDIFYKFMDVFHTVKNIDRIPLCVEDTKVALSLTEQFGFDISNALTCAVAISQKASEIHTGYQDLLRSDVGIFMKNQYGIEIKIPPAGQEQLYTEEGLEQYYRDALTSFRNHGINLLVDFHI